MKPIMKVMSRFLLYLVLINLLAACFIRSQELSSTSPDVTDAGQMIITPTLDWIPKATPTHVAIPATKERNNLEMILQNSCVSVDQKTQAVFDPYWDLLVQKGLSLSIISLDDGSTEDISYFSEKSSEGLNQFSDQFYISPNGKWLAYQDTTQTKLFVESTRTLSTTPGQVPIIGSQGKRSILRRWVSNDLVLLNYWRSDSKNFITTTFLNPFTKKEHEFHLEQMPNYLDQHLGGAFLITHYANDGELVLDPTRTRVIYPIQGDLYKYNVLWDLEIKKRLAQLRYYMEPYNDPLWTLDGSKFLILSYTQDNFAEWFLVSREGEIRQVTHFANFLKQEEYAFAIPSLSVDGRYLVFKFVYNNSSLAPKYLFLDLSTPASQGFCIDAIPSGTEPAPVWSPDGKYVLISNTEDTIGSLILVEVEKQKAYQIAKDVDAVGWIERP